MRIMVRKSASRTHAEVLLLSDDTTFYIFAERR